MDFMYLPDHLEYFLFKFVQQNQEFGGMSNLTQQLWKTFSTSLMKLEGDYMSKNLLIYYFGLLIMDVLCRGSYGIVKRVIDKNSGSQYACKFMQYENLARRDELGQELEILATLDHPNIIPVIDGYESKKRLAIIMEM